MIHVIGGGTISHISPHLALCAPAYGSTAKKIFELTKTFPMEGILHLTKMAGGSLETNEDVETLVDNIVKDQRSKIVFFNPAMVDFEYPNGSKYGERLLSNHEIDLRFIPALKAIRKIRQSRKDIFAVGFKATSNASQDEQYFRGLTLLKEASLNLVLANDVATRVNMIITPEEARYHVTCDRDYALSNLVDMTRHRSQLTFTKSSVVNGDLVDFGSLPYTLRNVVSYCINRNAYKPFRGSTAGHFAFKVDDNTFITSIRKSNFNHISDTGMVMVKTDGLNNVVAYGAKPSVGGQSQRIVFQEHPEYDCIVHFHCPIKYGSPVPQVSQREYECGSHECGQNTSSGLKKFGNLSAVYLQEHGPNIVFNSKTPPKEIIEFIVDNFDLSGKTGGLILKS